MLPWSLQAGGLDNDANSAFATTGPQRSRLGNYTQINGKTIAVSGTRRAIDQAGVADEYAYQLKKRGTELRRDIEFDLIHTYQVAQGGTAAAYSGQSAGGHSCECSYIRWIPGMDQSRSSFGNRCFLGW